MPVTDRTLRLQQDLRDALQSITDAQTRDLVRAWATAWDEIEPDLTAALLEQLTAGDRISRAQLLRSTRLRAALAVVAEQLQALAGASQVRIIGDVQHVVDTAGAAQASVIDSQLPPNFMTPEDLAAWSRVDARQITAIVERTTEQITALHKPLAPEAYAVVRRELIRGVAAGSNPRETARRMVRRAERVGFNGGLTRALVISRTETLDAHRRAAELAQANHSDVLAGWTWQATLDARTCPSCWSQHGTLHKLDEQGPNDHQQGRCARLPATKPWSELGIDVVEPPSLLPDAETAFTSLTAAEQQQILGPGRYAAWAAGEFPMDSWSVRRTTTGWRDSYAPAPVPQSSRGRSRFAA
jgi:SPP1 gp7 family putative phage head morphogenesis protein